MNVLSPGPCTLDLMPQGARGRQVTGLVVVEAVELLGSCRSRQARFVALVLRAPHGLGLLSHKFDHSPVTDWSFVVINDLQIGNE